MLFHHRPTSGSFFFPFLFFFPLSGWFHCSPSPFGRLTVQLCCVNQICLSSPHRESPPPDRARIRFSRNACFPSVGEGTSIPSSSHAMDLYRHQAPFPSLPQECSTVAYDDLGNVFSFFPQSSTVRRIRKLLKSSPAPPSAIALLLGATTSLFFDFFSFSRQSPLS